jgi:hypothetical protein
MRSISTAFAALALSTAFAFSISAMAQSQPNSHTSGTIHLFHRALPDATTATPTSGTFKVTINIKVENKLPTKSTVGCTVTIQESNTNTTTFTPEVDYENSETVAATATSTGYTCSLSLPYDWLIPASTSGAKITSLLGGSFYIDTGSETTSPAAESLRSASGALPIASTVPAENATTSVTINTSL